MNSSAFHLNYVIKDIIERKHRLYFLCEISPPFCQTKINKLSFGQSPRCSLFPEGTLRLASDVFQFLLSPSTVEVYCTAYGCKSHHNLTGQLLLMLFGVSQALQMW